MSNPIKKTLEELQKDGINPYGNAEWIYDASDGKYLMAGSNKNQRKTIMIPLNEVDAELRNSIKGFDEITGYSEDVIKKNEADMLVNELAPWNKIPGAGVRKVNQSVNVMSGLLGGK